jgi:hypothetical protein
MSRDAWLTILACAIVSAVTFGVYFFAVWAAGSLH